MDGPKKEISPVINGNGIIEPSMKSPRSLAGHDNNVFTVADETALPSYMSNGNRPQIPRPYESSRL